MPALDDPIPWADAWCEWCGETLPLERDPRRKYCPGTACIQAAMSDRRAQRLAAARAGKTCRRCSKPVVAKISTAIYCSEVCAQMDRRERHTAKRSASRAEARAGRTCQHCGAPVPNERPKHAIYCTYSCQHAAYHRRKMARIRCEAG